MSHHKTLNILWTLQTFWGLMGTFLNTLIVYVLYTERRAMATSVNMIIMWVVDIQINELIFLSQDRPNVSHLLLCHFSSMEVIFDVFQSSSLIIYL